MQLYMYKLLIICLNIGFPTGKTSTVVDNISCFTLCLFVAVVIS